MRKTKSTVSLFAVVLLMVSMIMPLNVNAAKKVKLNKSKITLVAGKTAQLKVLNNKKKVVWKSNKKVVAKVSKTGVVTAKKQGSAVITAKVGKKTYACKVVVKKPEATTAKQKVINHVLLNGSLDNSVLAGYELENLGYKCLVKENVDKTAVSGVIYNPLVDQIGYMDVKGSMVDASVFIAVPTENDETKLSLVIITLSTSGGELSDMNMLVTTLDQSTYTGNNLVFSNALIGSEVEESVHKQGNEITARAFENVSQMLNEAIGVKISDLGIKGIDDVLASNQ